MEVLMLVCIWEGENLLSAYLLMLMSTNDCLPSLVRLTLFYD